MTGDADPRVRDVLREAAAWGLLGRLFECPRDGWHREIAALARELGDDELTAVGLAAEAVASEGQYHSVFGPGGPAPPREASYHDTLELGSLMSELAVYYDAFGYSPRGDESPDHVSVEIGFVAYLKLKEAYALAQGEHERAELTAGAVREFVVRHLSMIAAPLATVLAASPLEYLASASRILAVRVGPPPRSTRLPVLQHVSADDDSGRDFECAT
jgi:nitrate reductase assembly molybdenum cofactor insertion protein NarJ